MFQRQWVAAAVVAAAMGALGVGCGGVEQCTGTRCADPVNAAGGGAGSGGGTGSTVPTEAYGSVNVANESGYTIEFLYLSSSGSDSWGPDLLGSHILSNHHAVTITNVPVGYYDLKAVTLGGAEGHLWGFYVGSGITKYVTFY